MSSRFSQRPVPGQPPPVCRQQPPPGPHDLAWPPMRAIIACTWIGPPGWPEPRTMSFNAQALWYPTFSEYFHTETLHAAILTAACAIPDLADPRLFVTMLQNYGATHFADGGAGPFSLTPGEPIQIDDPPSHTNTPGHEWHIWLAAYPNPPA